MTTRRLPGQAKSRSNAARRGDGGDRKSLWVRPPPCSTVAVLNGDRAAPRLIEHVRSMEGDVRLALSYSTLRRAILKQARITGVEPRKSWKMEREARRLAERFRRPRPPMAAAAVIQTRANQTGTTTGTSMQAARLISSPTRSPMKCLAQGAPASPGLGNSSHFKGRISGSEPSDILNLGDMDHTPADLSTTMEAAREPADPGIRG